MRHASAQLELLCTAIWSQFQLPSKCPFHPTWAAVDALPGPTGRIRRRRCPGKLIPAPAVLVSLFLSSVVTSEMQFRRPVEALGCPGRLPVLAGGDARPPGCPHRGAGPTQVGPGPIRQMNNSHESIKIMLVMPTRRLSGMLLSLHISHQRDAIEPSRSCLGECGIQCHSRFESGCLQHGGGSSASPPTHPRLTKHFYCFDLPSREPKNTVFQQNPTLVHSKLDPPLDADALTAAAQSSIHLLKLFFSVCRDLVAS